MFGLRLYGRHAQVELGRELMRFSVREPGTGPARDDHSTDDDGGDSGRRQDRQEPEQTVAFQQKGLGPSGSALGVRMPRLTLALLRTRPPVLLPSVWLPAAAEKSRARSSETGGS